jgi:hypothetical protein
MNTSVFLDKNASQFVIRYSKEEVQKSARKPKQKPLSVSSDI